MLNVIYVTFCMVVFSLIYIAFSATHVTQTRYFRVMTGI